MQRYSPCTLVQIILAFKAYSNILCISVWTNGSIQILYLTLRIKGYFENFGNDTLAVKFKMNLLSILMSLTQLGC